MQLHREADTIAGRGARLVFVGNGNRHFAEGFRKDLGLTEPIYVDTTRASYRALGMKRGFGPTLRSLVAWKHVVRALRAGFRVTGMQGDGLQLGGVLVVSRDGRVAYCYLSQEAGDHAPVSDVLSALYT